MARITRAKRTLNVVGLFAGIGGFERAFAKAGHNTELLCEIDPAAQAVLREHFPKVRIVGDIRSIRQLPRNTDVVCAGFPCQDLSSTGHKIGILGQRSSLIGEVFRLLEQRRAEWVVIENVPFMLHLKAGEAIRAIAKQLERLGYRWAYRVMDSQSFGVPHRRKRVYIVASLSGDPRAVLLSGESSTVAPQVPMNAERFDRPIGFYWTEGAYATGLAYDSVPPIKAGSTIGIPSPPAVLFPDGSVATPHICDAERLQGFDANWTRSAELVTRPSARWRLVGNAVTVPAASWLAERLSAPVAYDSRGDFALKVSSRWPDAAWGMEGKRFGADVSHFPLDFPPSALMAFLTHPLKPLSSRAANGFISRAVSGGLSFPRGFISSIRAHADRMMTLGL